LDPKNIYYFFGDRYSPILSDFNQEFHPFRSPLGSVLGAFCSMYIYVENRIKMFLYVHNIRKWDFSNKKRIYSTKMLRKVSISAVLINEFWRFRASITAFETLKN